MNGNWEMGHGEKCLLACNCSEDGGRGGVRSREEVAQRPMGGGLTPVMRCGQLCAAVSVERVVSASKSSSARVGPGDDDAKILTPPRRKKISGVLGLADQDFLYPT